MMNSRISAIFLGKDRLVIQAESSFQTLALLVNDRARLMKWPDEKRDAMLNKLAAIAEEFSEEPVEGNQPGQPSSLSTGESSPVKAEGTAKSAGGGCK